MLTIVGDTIEYDGKPFAIITAPLCGWRMDAIDCVNNHDDFLGEIVEGVTEEKRADDVNKFRKIINHAVDNYWLNKDIAKHMHNEITAKFGDK